MAPSANHAGSGYVGTAVSTLDVGYMMNTVDVKGTFLMIVSQVEASCGTLSSTTPITHAIVGHTM